MDASRDEDVHRDPRIAALAEEFDTSDMGDRRDSMQEAQLDVAISHRTYLVAIEEELMSRIGELASAEHRSAGDLANTWLRDRPARA